MAEGLGKFLGIKPIDASKEDIEVLRKVSDCVKTIKVKQVLGSYCIVCGALPTQIATYDHVGGSNNNTVTNYISL